MKKIIYFALIIINTLLIGCSDDETSNSPNDSVSFNGKYIGNLSYTDTEKATNHTAVWDSSNVIFEIRGTGTTYTIMMEGDPTEVVNVTSSGNTFAGSDEESTYSGKLDGNLLTFREVGEDSEYSWIGNFTGSKTSSGGGTGGSGSNSLSVSGEAIGDFWNANCGSDFTASYGVDGEYEWHLVVETSYDCQSSNITTGSYSIVEWDQVEAPNDNECFIRLYKLDGNTNDILDLYSRSNSGSLTISMVNGKKNVSVSNLTMDEIIVGGTKQVSFNVTSTN